MRATQTHLVPIAEMTPGMVATIRNSVIGQVVALASRELSLNENQLVVRDIEPYTDLGLDYSLASASTNEKWEVAMTGVAVGYYTVTGASTMADQRYVAIFGVRDFGAYIGATMSATGQSGAPAIPTNQVSLIKFDIGGATKAIWDSSNIRSYSGKLVGFTPAAVIIPQNASYNIYYYQIASSSPTAAKVGHAYLQLVGVTVEPRGKTLTP